MSCNVIYQWPLNTFLLTYYLLTYLLKSNPGNPVPATGYPVPKQIPTSNHYQPHDASPYTQCHYVSAMARGHLTTATELLPN